MDDFADTVFNERRVPLPVIEQQARNMARFREIEAAASSAFRLFLALAAVYVIGVALGQL